MTGGYLDAWPSSLSRVPETCNGFWAKAFSLTVELELAALDRVDGPLFLGANSEVLLQSRAHDERDSNVLREVLIKR